MNEITMEEVLELVSFERTRSGLFIVQDVKCGIGGDARGGVCGNVYGRIGGNVSGNIGGTVEGDIKGNVCGTINGRQWQSVETTKEKAIRLIEDGKVDEAIKLLQEGE